MAEKRYFYTDPLAAAWMIRHHGVKFEKYLDALDIAHHIVHNAHLPSHFYIHPDSLHLLEPKEGDLYLVKDAEENDDWLYEQTTIVITPALISDWDGRFDGEIIRRGGKPFFWPECEAA